MVLWMQPMACAVMFLVMVPLCTAAASAEKETCRITTGPDGTTYKPTNPAPPRGATMDWELKDGTRLAKGPRFYPVMVENVTADSITLKECSEYLRATWDESGAAGDHYREEAICRVNCSALLDPSLRQPVVNSSQWCLAEGFCGRDAALCIAAIVVLLVIASIPAAVWGYRKCKKLYTRVKKREIELQDVKTSHPDPSGPSSPMLPRSPV